MNPSNPRSPESLENEASEMPEKIDLLDYRGSMITMREKGYSYQEVAKWLSEKLGISITRNKIAYVVNTDPTLQDIENQEESIQDEMERRQ